MTRLLILLALTLSSAFALPTMVRLGYPNCVSCHIAPQGGGLLNQYGRGVDRAQSLKGGEYQPWQSPFAEFLSADGRVNQDFRVTLQQQDISTTGKPGSQLFRSRFFYRNATELGRGFRFSTTISGENTAVPRPAVPFDAGNKPTQVFVNSALISYRIRPTLEAAVGRDALPTGVNVADLNVFVRSRNRGGYYDAPTQAKLSWWGKRYQITGYGFAPGGNERAGQHESGGGLLAEYNLFGKGKTIFGTNVLRGTSASVDRTMVGPYMRLGFGRWGILAEHDITFRDFKARSVSFNQSAIYGQIFWAVREWFVPSLIVERLRVGAPFAEQLEAAKFEIAARLTSQVTISAGPRIQKDELTGRVSRSVVFQIALKTVH